MSYKDEILAFLGKPENLEIALEVSDYMTEFREKAHKQFWVMFTQNFQERLVKSNYHGKWRFQPLPSDKYSTQLGKCYLIPNQAGKMDKPLLKFAIGQGNRPNFYQLYRGVCWIGEAPKQPDHYLIELQNLLKEKGLTQTDSNWPGYDVTPYHVQSNNFIMQFKQNPEKKINQIANDFWSLFEDLRPLLEEINISTSP